MRCPLDRFLYGIHNIWQLLQ